MPINSLSFSFAFYSLHCVQKEVCYLFPSCSFSRSSCSPPVSCCIKAQTGPAFKQGLPQLVLYIFTVWHRREFSWSQMIKLDFYFQWQTSSTDVRLRMRVAGLSKHCSVGLLHTVVQLGRVFLLLCPGTAAGLKFLKM